MPYVVPLTLNDRKALYVALKRTQTAIASPVLAAVEARVARLPDEEGDTPFELNDEEFSQTGAAVKSVRDKWPAGFEVELKALGEKFALIVTEKHRRAAEEMAQSFPPTCPFSRLDLNFALTRLAAVLEVAPQAKLADVRQVLGVGLEELRVVRRALGKLKAADSGARYIYDPLTTLELVTVRSIAVAHAGDPGSLTEQARVSFIARADEELAKLTARTKGATA